ncbi:MAG: HEPN domain-containing protein [Lachnospiraceae bacterium]|nr:HEPN domain-containing protein [Lachnospiraceae bacterium]
MTKEQRQYKGLIMADLNIADKYRNDDDKPLRLQAAYHLQQAIEKTIKLKAEIAGLSMLWGHDIDVLLKKCDDNNIDIDVPKYIRDKADVITHWEAECRYFPIKVVRKDTLGKVYKAALEWIEQDDTK